jgi:hypothetical protein
LILTYPYALLPREACNQLASQRSASLKIDRFKHLISQNVPEVPAPKIAKRVIAVPIVNYPECGKEALGKAYSCPKCAYELRPQQKGFVPNILRFSLALLILVLMIGNTSAQRRKRQMRQQRVVTSSPARAERALEQPTSQPSPPQPTATEIEGERLKAALKDEADKIKALTAEDRQKILDWQTALQRTVQKWQLAPDLDELTRSWQYDIYPLAEAASKVMPESHLKRVFIRTTNALSDARMAALYGRMIRAQSALDKLLEMQKQYEIPADVRVSSYPFFIMRRAGEYLSVATKYEETYSIFEQAEKK